MVHAQTLVSNRRYGNQTINRQCGAEPSHFVLAQRCFRFIDQLSVLILLCLIAPSLIICQIFQNKVKTLSDLTVMSAMRKAHNDYGVLNLLLGPLSLRGRGFFLDKNTASI